MNFERLLIRLSELLPDVERLAMDGPYGLADWLRRFYGVLQYAASLNRTKCGTPDCKNLAVREHCFKARGEYVFRITLPLCEACIASADSNHPINSLGILPVEFQAVRFPIGDRGINHAEFIVPTWLEEEGKQMDE